MKRKTVNVTVDSPESPNKKTTVKFKYNGVYLEARIKQDNFRPGKNVSATYYKSDGEWTIHCMSINKSGSFSTADPLIGELKATVEVAEKKTPRAAVIAEKDHYAREKLCLENDIYNGRQGIEILNIKLDRVNNKLEELA